MNTRLLTPQDYLKAILNRKWLVLGALIVSLGVAWATCVILPKSYRSSTLLLAEEQKILNVKDVESATSDGSSDRLAMMHARITAMRQILLSRSLLTQVAHEFHLYGYDKDHASTVFEDGVVGRMRTAIKIEMAKDQSFLTLSFANESPTMARDVTARLASSFLDETSRSREEIAEPSTEFLQHDLDAIKLQLEQKEKAIAEFKQQHLGELPEQMDANLRVLDRLESEQTAQNELAKSLALRMASLDKSIRDYEEQGSDGNPRRMRDLRLARIKELERQLLGLMAVYEDN